MNNKFFDLLQPTIVQASMDEELPEEVRGKYFLNYNVIGIDYFVENFILTETSEGTPYLMLRENSWAFELEDSTEGTNLDIPRLYIPITEKFTNDDGSIFCKFIYAAMGKESVYAYGTNDFIAGKDYYLNYTLYNYLANSQLIEEPNFGARLPNYLDDNASLTKYWENLDASVYKDYTNLDYFYSKNKLLDNNFTEEELNNFYANFCKVILDNTYITDELRGSGNNEIYDKVLNYYANFQSDAASNSINTILNSLYGTSSTTSTCGCNSSTSQSSVCTTTCSELYNTAMYTYLQKMLGDIDFYKDWFYIEVTDNGTQYLLNDVMLYCVKTIVNEFIELDYSLNFTANTNRNCSCPDISGDESDCNYKILNNYLKVLDYIQNNELKIHKNKIKIYGEQFAKILPNLQF